LKIGARAILTVILTHGLVEVHRLYTTAQRDEFDFNIAYIPRDFEAPPSNGFEPVYMKKLFDGAFDLARRGYPWSKVPPLP
jgi:hypothetical protein